MPAVPIQFLRNGRQGLARQLCRRAKGWAPKGGAPLPDAGPGDDGVVVDTGLALVCAGAMAYVVIMVHQPEIFVLVGG